MYENRREAVTRLVLIITQRVVQVTLTRKDTELLNKRNVGICMLLL